MASAQQLSTDKALIDEFVRRGIFDTTDIAAFWGQFVGTLTCELHRLPNDEPNLRLKKFLATHWLRAFLCNFYEDDQPSFYWRPGTLRQEVYHTAMEMGVQILPMHPYSPVPDPRQFGDAFWKKRSALPGIKIDIASVANCCAASPRGSAPNTKSCRSHCHQARLRGRTARATTTTTKSTATSCTR